jgi:predicted GIY-YIG superfamily endonuclease
MIGGAIAREKKLKWVRELKKNALIIKINPKGDDLFDEEQLL